MATESSKIPVEERYCIQCLEKSVESEIHVLIFCDKYKDLRQELFSVARCKIENFDMLSPESKFIFLLQSEDIKLLQGIARFIYNAFELRCSTVNDTVNVVNNAVTGNGL